MRKIYIILTHTGTILSNQGFDNQSIGGRLKNIESYVKKAGLGFGLQLKPDGSGIGLSIFNDSDMEVKDGNYFVPDSKSSSMVIPLDDGSGIEIKNNGIKVIPNDHNYLTSLPGVGRKTANVVLLNAFNILRLLSFSIYLKPL